jgi:hypothetical protein
METITVETAGICSKVLYARNMRFRDFKAHNGLADDSVAQRLFVAAKQHSSTGANPSAQPQHRLVKEKLKNADRMRERLKLAVKKRIAQLSNHEKLAKVSPYRMAVSTRKQLKKLAKLQSNFPRNTPLKYVALSSGGLPSLGKGRP